MEILCKLSLIRTKNVGVRRGGPDQRGKEKLRGDGNRLLLVLHCLHDLCLSEGGVCGVVEWCGSGCIVVMWCSVG